MAIYGEIQAFDVTNILIVSVRYFGGTKLGVGSLIQAYKNLAYKKEQARIKRIANEKYAKELGYSSYAELVRARNKRKAEGKARKKAARKAKPSKKERKSNAIAAEIASKKLKQNKKIKDAEKDRNLKLESLTIQRNALYDEGNYKELLSKANELISYEPSANNYNHIGWIKRYLED